MSALLSNLYTLALDAAPLLTLGLLIAGLMKAWLPESLLQQHLGKPGASSVIKAALIGAPMPLCSCGVLPVAMGLRRAGASKGSTVSFLIATPETGIDSIALSYGLLGPVMAVVRPVVAIANGIIAGLLTGWTESHTQKQASPTHGHTSCCASKAKSENVSWRQGIHYTFGRLFADMLPWLLVGLLFAALVQTFVPPQWLAQWAQGPIAMLVMIAIGVPMYICASASTPIAAGLLLAGVSPGTVLVFLIAGPASNIASLGIIHTELGTRAVTAYLGSVVACAMVAGLGLDWLLHNSSLEVLASNQHQHGVAPLWLAIGTLVLLAIFAIKPLRQHALNAIYREVNNAP